MLKLKSKYASSVFLIYLFQSIPITSLISDIGSKCTYKKEKSINNKSKI